MAGAQCCENPPSLNPSSGEGSVLDGYGGAGGLRSYVTGKPETNKAILLASDVFGFESPILSFLPPSFIWISSAKVADKVAACGFFVVVPDFFYGDPYASDRPIATWIQSHSPGKGFEDAKSIIAALESNGFTAVGAAGFCWGAKVVAELAKAASIQAAVMLHPSFVTADDIKNVKVPIAILGAERDHISPPELLKEFQDVLSTKSQVDSIVKIFPGVAHGWSVRYDINDVSAVKMAEAAQQDMMDWFLKYVN